VPANKISVVYRGVNLKLIDSILEEKTENPVLIYVGRLVRHKRVDIILKLFKIIVMQNPNIQLYIIGIGPDYDKLNQLSRNLGIGDKVKFTGYVTEKEKYRLLKKAHIYLQVKKRG